MPVEAYALVITFAAISVLSGIMAVGAVVRVGGGPSGWRWMVLPTASAFLALYWVGHRLGLVAGPQVELFGFQVSIVLDVAVAIAAAAAMALVQAVLLRVSRPAR